ncbi:MULTISPECIES: integrating conjugative element protein [Pseudomonas]|uniref:integrating conjugative element protein n=1 Tax=Pseudomonas TaxID=286 RepID=UPI0006D47ED1|nr:MULTISPECIES: integrating conjugative element protein [Pseudomonas]MDF3866168.1 integrating conjugative element protein [Pseudomonas denitrificans (nom. rej.)]NNN26102.1 integrating conjugative element protein [Pseudomonas nitroreducens]OBY92193.1 integrating conjugative element protein [Pseudomonas sp. AU11447]
MKRITQAIGIALSMSSTVVLAVDPIKVESQGSVIGDDVLYSIGGGSAVTMGSAGQMESITVGAGWQNNLVCGNMSLNNTLENQLNGATQGFQNIMGSVIQNATGAVSSLPALILQRANPALYNLLTNGILQARLDYDRSKGSCRALAESMADIAGNQMGWGKVAEGQKMGQELASNSDAVAVVERTESASGNSGVTWVGGSQAGGAGQQPIRVVSDVTKAGYNLLNNRSVSDTSSIQKDTCSNGLVCGSWESPSKAAEFATRVLGEQQIQTCEGCSSASSPGVGLAPLIQETYENKIQALQELLKPGATITAEKLRDAGSDSLPVTRGVIMALRDERDQALLAQRLASEVALADVLEKSLLLQRMLITGSKEPNVNMNKLAVDAVLGSTDTLQQLITNLKTELDMRQQLAKNSPMAIVERGQSRAENSRAVLPGAPETDRLQQLQKPATKE